MKNVVVCKNCNTENPFHALNCKSCKSFLRARVVNIDFWNVFWKLFELPTETFKTLIFAEHKNFFAFTFMIVAFKHALNKTTILDLLNKESEVTVFTLFISSILFVVLIVLFAIIITFVTKFNGVNTKLKDNLTITVFSFVPLVLSLLILTPVQYALFGSYWFSSNPSPFLIKPAAAFGIAFIEFIMLVWSFLNIGIGLYTQTKSKLFSFSFTMFFLIAYCLFILL